MHEKMNVLLMACIVLLVGSGCPASGLGGPGSRGSTEINDPVARAKLSPGLLLEIENTGRIEGRQRKLEVLVRTQGALGTSERSAVEAQGGRIGSVTGNIAIVTIAAENVVLLAGLKFIVSLDLSRKQRLREDPAKESHD